MAASSSDADGAASVEPIHVVVPGRARLHIAALRGDESLRHLLEAALPDAEIHRAGASTLTGNLLVHFDRQVPLVAVVARVERVLHGTAPAEEPDRSRARVERSAWHSAPVADALHAFQSTRGGLPEGEAQRRLAEHGRNELLPAEARSHVDMLLEQLESLPVLLLAGAAALSLATGGLLDAAVILGVVGLNAAIGFVTESRSERIIGTLRLPIQAVVPVRRDGRPRPIATHEIVPGDVLALQPGLIIGADARVLAANSLSVDESMLTGESLPAAKTENAVSPDAPLAERASMVYRGSAVVGGSGLALVVATGQRTEAGQIQALTGAAEAPDTPMQRQLADFGRQLVALSAAVCAVVLVIGLLRGHGFLRMLKSSIALAVAAVPEGLPTVATTALAIGVEDMRRRHILVRRLDAIETLAAVNVIGFDKTGTLTENRMSAVAVACGGQHLAVEHDAMPINAPAGSALAQLLEIIALCNETRLTPAEGGPRLAGTPTEAALLRLALVAGIDVVALRQRHPVRATQFRAEKRQYMVTLHEDAAGSLLAIKGNPEQVLARCDRQLGAGRQTKLDGARRRAILEDNSQMAEQGLRVLGVAFAKRATAAEEAAETGRGAGRGFVWLGLVGLADPARRGAGELLAQFDRAGIGVIMMTGDQPVTARAIAGQLNLANGAPIATVEASEFQKVDAVRFADLVQRTRVFARVSPADKLRIVEALQRTGHVVAVTGDGINDSPALRAADVGIVMGRGGTDVARDVADIVLEHDDLGTMIAALERGRTTYANIRKAIRYLLATNLSEILVMLFATGFGVGSPLSPIQLLWINLLSDVLPALGLALEPAERGVLERPPRAANQPIMAPQDMPSLAREGALIAAGGLAAYGFGLWRHGAARAGSLCFTSLVGAQLLHALTARSQRSGLFSTESLAPNRPLAAALLGSAALQVGVIAVPLLRRFMGLAPLDVVDGVAALSGAALPYLANEAIKAAAQKGVSAARSPLPMHSTSGACSA